MTRSHLSRGAGVLLALALSTGLGGCDLPRSGPSKSDIVGTAPRGAAGASVQGNAFVIPVTSAVSRAAHKDRAFGFPASFRSAGLLDTGTIQPGDSLRISVFENIQNGLMASSGGSAGVLDVQIGPDGDLFVPYAGQVHAAGQTVEKLRQRLTSALEEQTPDPQVVVTRTPGAGATVSIIGEVGAQGVYTIERANAKLSGMLARAGGISPAAQSAEITVMRGSHKGHVMASDLFADPANDIAMRDGDRVLVEKDDRTFVVIGATGTQRQIPFLRADVSAMEALAQAGGLDTRHADPTGVFVLRSEPEASARAVLGRPDLKGRQRIVYVLDLTKSDGMFMASEFRIADGDMIYVTEAPFSQWTKLIGAITGSANAVTALDGMTSL